MTNVMAYDRPIELYEDIWPCRQCVGWHVELVADWQTSEQIDGAYSGTASGRGPEVILRIWHSEDCPTWERRR